MCPENEVVCLLHYSLMLPSVREHRSALLITRLKWRIFLLLLRRTNKNTGDVLSFQTLTGIYGQLEPEEKIRFSPVEACLMSDAQAPDSQFTPKASVFRPCWYLSHALPPLPHVCLRLATCCHIMTEEKIHTDTNTDIQRWHFSSFFRPIQWFILPKSDQTK